MNKPLTYALLLATALGLAACEKTPEDKMESAKESVSEAMENLGDAAKDTGDAIEQKTNEALGNEPTTGEKIEDAASDAADAIEDAGDDYLLEFPEPIHTVGLGANAEYDTDRLRVHYESMTTPDTVLDFHFGDRRLHPLKTQRIPSGHDPSAYTVKRLTAPARDGAPVLASLGSALAAAPKLEWICYLSTVGVYGDHDGAWVDEDSECRPGQPRSIQRLAAEQAWRDFADERGVPLAIFRLSGIYGPGRNAFVNIEKGTARRIVKPDQVFNRIHRDDIATAFAAAAERWADGIFNITDDEPSPPQDVVAFAHELAGVEPPPEIAFDDADLSPMGRSFYGENKRVSNAKSKRELGMTYAYPDYRTALTRMWQEESWR